MKAVYVDCYAMISADGPVNLRGGCYGSINVGIDDSCYY